MLNVNQIKPRLLKLVDYNHPVLRQKTQKILFPLSEEDQQLIADMKYSIHSEQLIKAGAPWDAAVGMAANQWGYAKSIMVYCPDGDTVNGLSVVINPSYTPLANPKTGMPCKELVWEGCFSIPLATGNIDRYTNIIASFQNESGDTIKQELSGWPARVFQHETDHLYGILYDDEKAGKYVEVCRFATKDEIITFRQGLKRRPDSEEN
jgi:peptide deformylase